MFRVLKTNGTGRYYTSFIGDRQYVYSFKNYQDAEMCRDFLIRHKKKYSIYPSINCGQKAKKVLKDPVEDYDIIIDEEPADVFETMCMLNNVGIAEIKYFNYTYDNYKFSIHLSTSNLIETDYFAYSIPVLNRLLRGGSSTGEDSEHLGGQD